MPQPERADSEPKSTGEVVGELWQLVQDYAKQETLDPLKALKSFVIWGSAAALCFALAGLYLTIGVMRVLQVEGRSWSNGNWSFAAYVAGLVVCFVAMIVLGKTLRKGKTA